MDARFHAQLLKRRVEAVVDAPNDDGAAVCVRHARLKLGLLLLLYRQNKNKRAFAPELCDRLMNADPFVALSPPAHIFIAIDPNGGGDSDFAMCSAYYDRGTMIICGLESVRYAIH